MFEVIKKERCTGCTACVSICPKKAISMAIDNNGFMHPIINQEKCIDCGLCKKTCPVLNTKENKTINECYVAYNKNKEEKKKASSGAIFSLIANYILEKEGIIIGAAFDEDNKLKHVAITKKEDLDKLKGSKYLQSDLSNIFKYIKENIKDKKILFVGTPCQVAGLKSYVKNNDNLITIDLICHGVPSPKLFEKYIKELEQKNNDKLVNYNFRDKSTGWDTYSNTATFKNNIKTELSKDNDYMKLFLSDIALRESCYNCNFKLGNKYSDITLGDFWGVQKYYPDMYNKEGVSAIIINTKQGQNIFDEIRNDIIYKDCKLQEILEGNPSLETSSKRNKKSKKFFEDIEKKDIKTLSKEYSNKNTIIRRVKNKIKRIIKQLIRH